MVLSREIENRHVVLSFMVIDNLYRLMSVMIVRNSLIEYIVLHVEEVTCRYNSSLQCDEDNLQVIKLQ